MPQVFWQCVDGRGPGGRGVHLDGDGEVPAIVTDNGFGVLKGGFARDENPQVILPTLWAASGRIYRPVISPSQIPRDGPCACVHHPAILWPTYLMTLQRSLYIEHLAECITWLEAAELLACRGCKKDWTFDIILNPDIGVCAECDVQPKKGLSRR